MTNQSRFGIAATHDTSLGRPYTVYNAVEIKTFLYPDRLVNSADGAILTFEDVNKAQERANRMTDAAKPWWSGTDRA